MMRDMTDGPGQQPQEPQEPRTGPAGGEREVLEGRVIPSRRHEADPRQQFRQATPPPQAPEPGPAWSPQAEAAAQPAPPATPAPQPAEPWSAPPQQPALAPSPQATAPQLPQQASYATPQAQPEAQAPQPPQQGAYATPQAQPQAPQQAGYGYPQGQAPGPQPEAQAPQPGAYGYPQPQGQVPPQQAGYGYPQAQAQAPQQGGYGYPQPQAPAPQAQAQAPQQPQAAQGTPHVPFAGGATPPRPAPRARQAEPATPTTSGSSGSGSDASTPDWNALAEQQESGARRKRILMLTGGIVAVAVIAGGVATAVVMSGKDDGKSVASPSSSATGTASQQPLPPAPSFSSVAPPPPANPLDYLNSPAKDKAPLTPDSLFPGKQFVWEGRTYTKTVSDVTTSCAKNARQALATALTTSGCQKLVRATYTDGALAVTVGVAVFPDDAHSKKVQKVSQYLAPLNGGGIASFCRAVRCQMTSNAVGRYAYFAIAGYKNGTTLAATDTEGKQAADDASDFAFSRIVQRGKDAAAADPARQ